MHPLPDGTGLKQTTSATHTGPIQFGGRHLPVEIRPQPDDETCGPTCLHAVYRYWDEKVSLNTVVDSFRTITDEGRGTLAVMLGTDALSRGYQATLYTFNLQVFDPTWFNTDGEASASVLRQKLSAQRAARAHESDRDTRLIVATDSYLEYLELGGKICFRELNSRLISSQIKAGKPLLTGLSATYLYRCAREYGPNDVYDDVRGMPSGHFVVIHGYDAVERTVLIADPLANNPGFESQQYIVPMPRLIAAIMLGILTYDANLLVIEPQPIDNMPGRAAGKRPKQ